MKKILITLLSFIMLSSCRNHLPYGDKLWILPETQPKLFYSTNGNKTIGIWLQKTNHDSIFVLIPSQDQSANLLYVKTFYPEDTIFIQSEAISLPGKNNGYNYCLDKPSIGRK